MSGNSGLYGSHFVVFITNPTTLNAVSHTAVLCVRLNKCSLFSKKYKRMAAIKVNTFGTNVQSTEGNFARRKLSVQQRFGNTVGQCKTLITPELPPADGPL